MRLVHSFSSVRCSKDNLKVHVITFTLSALYAKNSGFEIVLHTDEFGKFLFQHAPYDEIIVDLPEPPEDTRIFAWCKFVAMANEPIDSIHIDGDVFLKRPEFKELLSLDGCDIICQNLEEIGIYPYHQSSWNKESYAWQNCKFPTWMSRKFNKMYNVGIIGFKDEKHRDAYHTLYNEMMEDFKINGKSNDCVPELISEQKLLYDYATHNNLKVKKLLDHMHIMKHARSIGYQHLLGEAKYKMFDKTKEVLKKLDSDLYDKTLDVLEKARKYKKK